MQRNTFETILGAIVLAGTIGFGFTLYKSKASQSDDTYNLSAHFTRIDGIKKGTEVKVSGITVGKVLDSELDPKTFLAKLKIELDKKIQLPTDSALEITQDGLFGKKYLALSIGSDPDLIKPEGNIQFTQAGADLMQLLNKFMFSKADETKKTDQSQKETNAY